MNKKVKVKSAIKVCYLDKPRDVTGILTFLGENKEMGISLQATIGRMPIKLTNIDQIELID